MSDFITEVVKTFKTSESPEIFFYWSAVSAISAVMKKNVWLDRGGHYKLYPNTYCFLVAASGMKKGIPINLARQLVGSVNNTRLISGRNSIQKVLEDLGKPISFEESGIMREANGYLISSELAAFFVKDPDAMTILTDVHDTGYYEKDWKYSLKSGNAILLQPCVSLLGATNEEHFSAVVPTGDVNGGFIARTFVIFTTDKGKLNSLTRKGEVIDLECLKKWLLEISKVKGEFEWTNEAIDLYDEWYYTFYGLQHNDPTGTVNRIGDQILKLAMCISLANGRTLKLEVPHIKEAITRGLSAMNGAKQITMGGKGDLSGRIKLVIRELITAPDHEITRKQLLSKHWGNIDAFDLDKIIETLNQAGAIDIRRHGPNTYYSMKKEHVQSYLEYKRSVN